MAVIEEVDLKEFIAEAKHDGMSGFKPLFNVNEALIVLEPDFFVRYFFHFLVEMYHKALEKQILLLEVSVFGHCVSFICENVLLLECWIFDKVNVP